MAAPRGRWSSTAPSSSTPEARSAPSAGTSSPPATSSTTPGIRCSTSCPRPATWCRPRRRGCWPAVTTNAGNGSASICPPLRGLCRNVQRGHQDGPPITQYCSGSPGGLPNFPSMTAPSGPPVSRPSANANGIVTVNWTDPPDQQRLGHHRLRGLAQPSCRAAPAQPDRSQCHHGHRLGPDPGSHLVQLHGDAPPTVWAPPARRSRRIRSWPRTCPTAPTNASATTNQDGSITVSWTDPVQQRLGHHRLQHHPQPEPAGRAPTPA